MVEKNPKLQKFEKNAKNSFISVKNKVKGNHRKKTPAD